MLGDYRVLVSDSAGVRRAESIAMVFGCGEAAQEWARGYMLRNPGVWLEVQCLATCGDRSEYFTYIHMAATAEISAACNQRGQLDLFAGVLA